jgi:hypothetical protein
MYKTYTLLEVSSLAFYRTDFYDRIHGSTFPASPHVHEGTEAPGTSLRAPFLRECLAHRDW